VRDWYATMCFNQGSAAEMEALGFAERKANARFIFDRGHDPRRLLAKVWSDERDARLIAAAPELLSVCQAMAGDLQALLDGDDFSGMNDAEMFGVMLRSLRAAIAKAEGSDE
jgi:hypothetical protein